MQKYLNHYYHFQGKDFVEGIFDGDTLSELDNELLDEESDWGNWKKSEVLKISDCNELTLELKDGRSNNIQSEMSLEEGKQTVLIVENVQNGKVDFAMNDASDGRVCTEIIYNNFHYSYIVTYKLVNNSFIFSLLVSLSEMFLFRRILKTNSSLEKIRQVMQLRYHLTQST